MARDLGRLRGIIRSQKEEVDVLQHEVSMYQSRLNRVDEQHRLELSRLHKECEYHKRLRQGADQRSWELQQQLARAQAQANDAPQQQSEEHHTLIEQSQILVSKNSELTYKLKTVRHHKPDGAGRRGGGSTGPRQGRGGAGGWLGWGGGWGAPRAAGVGGGGWGG